MRRYTTLLLSLALLLPACGGGSDNPVAVITGLLQAAGCTAEGIENYSLMFDAIEVELNKTPVPAVINIDTPDLIATGTVTTLAGDLDDGFDPGDNARIIITNATFFGTVAGSGAVTVGFAAADSIDISGNFALDDGSCSATFTNINVNIDPTDENDYGTGSFGFSTQVDGDTLAGTVVLNGGPTAFVNASFNGGPSSSFTIDLDSFQPNVN